MSPTFDLQGHRGARGLRPENTLSSFEAAFDAGVTSVETDLHLTRDGVVVLCHDPLVSERLFLLADASAAPPPSHRPAVSGLTLTELRAYRVCRNPDPVRFPEQDDGLTPLAALFASQQGFDPYAVPTLADLFAFAAAYAGPFGARAGKTEEQRQRAARVRFDLELKRVPFFPQTINDDYDGRSPDLLERRVVEEVRAAGMVARAMGRSFDHRCVRLLTEMEPALGTAVLIADTAPVNPVGLVRDAGAQVYSPSYEFLDERLVRRLHEAGVRVVPWTVNEPDHWQRLLAWGVDGLTTDFPDRLGAFLRTKGVAF
jgi:glycerophosphoryl diester phosphodiesterase